MEPSPRQHPARETIFLIGISIVVVLGSAGGLVVVLGLDQVGQLVGVGAFVAALLGGVVRAELWLLRVRQVHRSRDPERTVEELADVLRADWIREAERAGWRSSDLLQVTWQATGPWSTAADFSGGLDDIGTRFLRLDTRRLVIVGGPGSGKTFLANELTRQLLEMRRQDPTLPVPMVVPMSSWEPDLDGSSDARAWIAEYLAVRHPALRAEVGGGKTKVSLAFELLRSGRILPILDGLDEMRKESRRAAVRELNRLLVDGGHACPMVLTSRVDEFNHAVLSKDGTLVVARLTGASIVELQPLATATIAGYLTGSTHTADPAEAGPWRPVIAEITAHPTSRLATLLSSPLMAWLARTIYYDSYDTDHPFRPRDLQDDPDPEGLLLDRLILSVFSQKRSKDGRRRPRWTPEQAQYWLTFLAHHLYNIRPGGRAEPESHLEWWNLPKAARRVVGVASGLVAGVFVGVATGLGFYYVFDATVGIVCGLALGLPIGIVSVFTAPAPTEFEIRIRDRKRPALIAGSLVGGIAAGAGAVVEGGSFGIVIGLFLGGLIGIAYGLTAKADITHAPTPDSTLRRDRNVMVAYAVMYGVPIGLAVGFVRDPWSGVAIGLACALAGGFVYGPVWTLSFLALKSGVGTTAWFRFQVARLWLAHRRQLPLALMSFLRDAHDREVLRRVGAVYEFRHGLLRDRLARQHPTRGLTRTQPVTPSEPNS